MKFEVVESADGWIVRRDGVELACFSEQEQALAEVSRRLKGLDERETSCSLAVRYAARG